VFERAFLGHRAGHSHAYAHAQTFCGRPNAAADPGPADSYRRPDWGAARHRYAGSGRNAHPCATDARVDGGAAVSYCPSSFLDARARQAARNQG